MHVIMRGINDRGEVVLKLERRFKTSTPWENLYPMYEHLLSIPEVVRITVDIAK
jgi:hypothetical protein